MYICSDITIDTANITIEMLTLIFKFQYMNICKQVVMSSTSLKEKCLHFFLTMW